MTEAERRLAARRRLWTAAFTGVDLAGRAVLDAGTGEGWFTRFLAERAPARLDSISCFADDFSTARTNLDGLADRVEFRVADLTAMPEIASASFDVVAGDYLVAATAGLTPFREIDLVKELVRVLRPGGRLVLTGWDCRPEPRNRTEQAFVRLFQLREAVHHLAGRRPFREHPRRWVVDRLEELSVPVERVATEADVHHDLGWFLAALDRSIGELPNPLLRDALRSEVEPAASRLASDLGPAAAEHAVAGAGFSFGEHYAVVGCKVGGGLLL
ncbi:MAG: class I SAM-dependent methyltransferase [Planctomycetia bacterium]